jgi:DNA polymerase-1
VVYTHPGKLAIAIALPYLGNTMPIQTNPLILVDGSSYLYRAFHALPALTNSKGFPTGAIYGVVNMLQRLLTDYEPTHFAVVFDAKGKTFRDELYQAYKATRHDMPTALIQQIAPLHRIIQALGLPILIVDGVEADDVIGTLATQAAHAGTDVIISTGDKDLAQLVNSHITLINTMTHTYLDPTKVQEKFGVLPNRIIDYLTLVGDTADNIPGIPQVGPKTAIKWLQTYGSLDAIIAHADQITGKAGETLRAALSQIPLTKELVTIKCDLTLPTHFTELLIKPPNKADLVELYKEMEFKSWLHVLLTAMDNTADKYAGYELITSQTHLDEWVEKLSRADLIALDTETTSLNYMAAKIVGISFAIAPGKAAYIPFGHDYADAPKQLTPQVVLTQLQPILVNDSPKKIGQNIKYDIEVLANHGISLAGIAYDTMLESYILDSISNGHDMDSLALKYLGWRTITFTDIAGKGHSQLAFNQIAIETAGTYAAEDADVTMRLHQALWPRIMSEPGLKRVLEDIEMPLIPVLARIERNGVLIDPKKLTAQGKQLTKRLQALKQDIFHLSGKEFNMNSPKQLQAVLFSDLKLPVLQKTATGQASTADSVLQELALDFELPRLIIEYRALSKLISTYTSRLTEQMNPATGRIHTSYNQAGTATGRLSSSEPNLQNIPIRSLEGRRIRQAFIAPIGYKLMSADYSQIELRLMAHISSDPGLLAAFKQNLDIHKATAAEVWDIPIEQVTADRRRDAKAINFGLIYGMSAFGLARQLGVDHKAAQDYINRYFARYPQVRAYMDNTRAQAREKGYVETLWGRRLYLPNIQASQVQYQKAAERTAINAPLQGSAADIIKLAMIQIDHWLQEEKVHAKMIMQVHDELVFEVVEEAIDHVADRIRYYMTNVVTMKVPLLVSIGIGDNWDQASEH